jgi:N-formylglutamate amidohydrolase
LADALAVARSRFGYAILLDLHSMPSIPMGQPGHGARIVIGDHFGVTSGEWLVDLVMAAADRLNELVSRNQPYAGGHIIRTHGNPGQAIHAVQIEIDRRLYLTADRLPDSHRIAAMARWFADLVSAVARARPAPEIMIQAAE